MWLVGGICGWLECIGVVSGRCCKEVYRFPHNITYPYSTCLRSFFCSSHPYFFNLLILKKGFFVFYCIWLKIQVCLLFCRLFQVHSLFVTYVVMGVYTRRCSQTKNKKIVSKTEFPVKKLSTHILM